MAVPDGPLQAEFSFFLVSTAHLAWENAGFLCAEQRVSLQQSACKLGAYLRKLLLVLRVEERYCILYIQADKFQILWNLLSIYSTLFTDSYYQSITM